MNQMTTAPAKVSNRTISSMSNEAQRIISQAKGKPQQKKEAFDVEKNAIGVKQHNKPTPKVPEVPIKRKEPQVPVKEVPIDKVVMGLKEQYDTLTPEQKQEFMKQIRGTVIRTPRQLVPYKQYMVELIENGTHTKAEIVDMTIAKFPDVKKSNIQAEIGYNKNPKYLVFPKLIIESEDGTLKFNEN
jgi:hypothetical protein